MYVLNRVRHNTMLPSARRANTGPLSVTALGMGSYLPIGIAVDREASVHQLESENRIQKFSPTGQFLSKWGTPGDDGELDGLASAGVRPRRELYVVDHSIAASRSSPKRNFTKWGT